MFLPFAHKNKVPVILWGPTGIGKTTCIFEYAERVGIKKENIHVLHLASQEPGDLVGLPTREGLNLTAEQQVDLLGKMAKLRPDDDMEVLVKKISKTKTIWSRPEWLPDEDSEEEHIFFLDEFNRGPKYVLACMFPFILEGRMHTHKVPRNSWIIAAGNPGGGKDYDVTEIRDRALISRLCHITVKPSKEEWLIRHEGVVHSAVHKVVSKHPELLGFAGEDLGFEIEADARSLHTLGAVLKGITKEEWQTFGLEFCMGCVGKTAASFIEQEWRDNLESISPEDVLNNYREIRGDVKAFSTVDHIRSDVISGANSQLLVYIKKMGERNEYLTDKQIKNLDSYLGDIPRDMCQAFLSQAASGESFCNDEVFQRLLGSLGKADRLYLYILEANNKKEAERERKLQEGKSKRKRK
jgi:hypothetical protein